MSSYFDKLPNLAPLKTKTAAQPGAFDPYAFLSVREEPQAPEERFKEARSLLISEPHTALKYLESAANEEHAASLDLLGMLYATGELLEKNEKRAAELFRKAAVLGESRAKFHLAMALREGFGTQKNLQESFAWLRIAAREKFPEAIFALAEAYDLGIGTEKNPEIAERFFSEAAFKGEKRAVERMIRLSSQGPMPNPRLCLRWLFKGAVAKIPYCLLAIARYWLEHRTPAVEKALGLLEEGALIEDIACLNELSAFWSSGRFAPKDYVSAVVYAHMAATRSDWRAQRHLEKLRKTAHREELMEAAAIASMPSSEEVVAALIKRRQKRAA